MIGKEVLHMHSKVILITGASSGIGKESAEYFHDKGYIVYGTSRKASKGVSTTGYGFYMIEMNVCNDNSVKTAIDSVYEREGRIDVIVNNAGIAISGSIEDIGIEEIKINFETNFYGAIRVCKEALRIMRPQHDGYIINISSIAGKIAIPFDGCYSATKSAVEAVSESLSMEVKNFGIKVVIVEPGDIDTGMYSRSKSSAYATGDSVYFKHFSHAMKATKKNESIGSKPIVIAELIERIINNKKPSLRYVGGNFMDKIVIPLKNIMPSRCFERLVMKRYDLCD